jgi:2-desacetyl-2-hydroxyethyl bacteriochlorophyllide A dehydrogenase
MKALVYTANEEVSYRDEADPSPAPGEALVRIDAVGICGSDMHAYLGHDSRRVPPLILGHEAAGTVIAGTRPGQRVILNPLIACGTCNACLGGRSNLCAERDLIGMYRPGAFAERITIPESNLIDIPDGMDAAHAALTEPAATALHAVNLAARSAWRPLSEARALVIGGGSVGLFAALVLRDHGCRHVTLAETNAHRRVTAQTAAIGEIIDPIATPPAQSAFELVIDAVGSGATRGTASASVCPGGTIVHIGLMDNQPGFDVRYATLQEVTFIGTYTYTPVDLRITIAKLHAGDLGPLDWIEQRPLMEGAAAFDDLLHARTAAPKIVLRP